MIFYSFFALLLAVSVNLQHIDENLSIKSRISIALNEFVKTGTKPYTLIETAKTLKSLKHNKTYQNEQVCATCKYVVDGVLQYRKSGTNKDLMSKLIDELCVIFSNWGKVSCKGYTKIGIDTILYIIDNRLNLTADRVCSIYLQNSFCRDPNERDWSINIPSKSNNIETIKNGLNANVSKVLHLTDIHFDSDYIPGSNAVCEEQLCCQKGIPKNPLNAAGYWGDYHVCDMPWHSVLNLMDQVTTAHKKIDYIYYTGDIMSHASWMLTKEKNIHDITQLFNLFSTTFNATPVYPIIGNHEAHPCNFYSPPNITAKVGSQWLFDLIADKWSKWLPADAKQTIKKGGYYTVLVKKGFRIIALNSNVCYTSNLWLIYNDVDPYGELQWLVDTLLKAEQNGEAVHILSHVPPGHIFCWKKWNDQFNRIVRRFSNTIKAHFNGHTHIDEIRVFLNENKTNAINVAYNGGSFTTFVGMNPNYRIYDMNDKSYEITDYDNWIFNLTEANKDKNTPPNWFKLYSLKEAYGLQSTDNKDLYDWLQTMKNDSDKQLLQQYFRFQFRESAVNTAQGCDEKCLNTLLCSITSVDFKDAISC